MLPNFSQFSPLGPVPPSPLMQGTGGMPGAGQSPGFGGGVPYGQGLYGQGQGFYAQGGYSPFLGSNPFMSPYTHHQGTNSLYGQPAQSAAYGTALQIIPLIGHLAQHVHQQSGVSQQIGIALNHLAQQLAVLSQQVQSQVQSATGLGLGVPQGQNGPFAGVGQPFGFNPFVGGTGFGAQGPAWAAQRSQTIQ